MQMMPKGQGLQMESDLSYLYNQIGAGNLTDFDLTKAVREGAVFQLNYPQAVIWKAFCKEFESRFGPEALDKLLERE